MSRSAGGTQEEFIDAIEITHGKSGEVVLIYRAHILCFSGAHSGHQGEGAGDKERERRRSLVGDLQTERQRRDPAFGPYCGGVGGIAGVGGVGAAGAWFALLMS